MGLEISDLTDANLIGAYRELRDRRDQLKDKHAKELAPYNTQMGSIESELLKRMDARGAENSKTPHGTAYKSIVSSVKVVNSGAFLDWLQETGSWECADIRGAKKEVEAYMEEHAALPPGLDVNRMVKCGVRKPTGVQ